MSELLALLQVMLIDISLSGDNAIVIGMAAAGLQKNQRKKAIALGILCAIGIRIVFSFMAVQLLSFPALSFVGGLMLLWVCWKMFQDIKGAEAEAVKVPVRKTLLMAVTQIIIADVSMSLDNVLAVAGASQDHIYIMAFGLILSIGLMAFAANLVVEMLTKWKWLNYVGLAIIFYVALSMLWKTVPFLTSYLG